MTNTRLLLVVPLGLALGGGVVMVAMPSRPSGEWSAVQVDTSGMTPGFDGGSSRVDTQVDAYAQPGDVGHAEVVVYESAGLDRFCLARVVGAPGSRVVARGEVVQVDGVVLEHSGARTIDTLQRYDEEHAGRHYVVTYDADGLEMVDVRVGPSEVFLLPDDRTGRQESCFGGLVSFGRLQGRVR